MVHCADRPFVNALAIGDSVSVDGVCLTVETLAAEGFAVTVSPETLQRSTLAQRVDTDWPVNLEPALRMGDRLGGHFVTGHVDGIGQVQRIQATDESWEIGFTVPPVVGRLVVLKGSVAINGVSLTVADCTAEGQGFSVAVIPLSFANTNLRLLKPHSAVNIETDVLGKYVDKLMRYPAAADPLTPVSDLNPDFLMEHGFV